jgi:hypothetical protein
MIKTTKVEKGINENRKIKAMEEASVRHSSSRNFSNAANKILCVDKAKRRIIAYT